MDVDIHWENKTSAVLRVTCSGTWNWADMDHAVAVWQHSRLKPPENLCVIVDLRSTTMPIDAVLHLRDAASFARQPEGLVVVLASSASMVLVFRMFVAMYKAVGGKFRLATDEIEAHTILGLPD